MFQTFKAVLQGNRLEWLNDVPKQSESEQPVEVHVTLLQKTDIPVAGQTETKLNEWFTSVEQPTAMLSSRRLGPTLYLARLLSIICAIIVIFWLCSQWHLGKDITTSSILNALVISALSIVIIAPVTRYSVHWTMYESKEPSKAKGV